MSDSAEMWREFSEGKKRMRAKRKPLNIAAIQSEGLEFKSVNNDTCLLFRPSNGLKVDYWPSANKWRVAGASRTFYGGVNKFIDWYKREAAK